MEAFFYIGIASCVFGGIVGLFSRTNPISISRIFVKSVYITLMFLVFVFFGFSPKPKSDYVHYYLTAALYWIIPYLTFFLLPCFSASALTIFIRRRIQKAKR